MADTPDEILVVREHLITHLGAPDDVVKLSGNPNEASALSELEVAFFAPGGPDSPVVFATCGASLAQMADGSRAEAIFITRPAPSEDQANAIIEILGAFSTYAEREQVTIGLGDVLPAADQLEGLGGCDALLVVPPVSFVETFQAFLRSETEAVQVVWLVPVFESEAEYALENGPQALMMLFAAQGVDLTLNGRDEANTLLDPEDAAAMAQSREAQMAEELARNPPEQQVAAKPAGRPRLRPQATSEAFEAFDDGDEVMITIKVPKEKKKKAPEPKPEETADAIDSDEGGASTPAPRHAPSPGRRPPPARRAPLGARKPGTATGEVRFDLNKGRASARPESFQPPPKKERPAPQTPAQKAEDKRKRVEALKNAAKEKAARAKKSD